ncbi:pPIWI_RE_Z domain-containing protein [Prauserella endophytica]|uniref:pPIWI-RE three-gene island domain-containing protein n=1 Tax=Prauserella endophytica TaxID=1592324 RepID=A0ABY2RT20_9PSEU|nr:hypothetical protein [Prauserella endophytica]TKG59284.1 hypothetical protein FCN18_36985 [Prauserella endophytica]
MARDRQAWHASVRKALRKPAQTAGLSSAQLTEMLAVELGLFALAECASGSPAGGAWSLLFGYDFRQPHHRAASQFPQSLRWLIGELKSERKWVEALKRYRAVPDHLRLFDIIGVDQPPQLRPVSVAANREDAYRRALAAWPAHRDLDAQLAEAGARYSAPRIDRCIVIPAEALPARSAKPHRRSRKRRRILLRWAGLETAAREMDGIDQQQNRDNAWYQRIRDLRLHARTSRGLRRQRSLRLEDIVHLAGMPAVGKTTLLIVAAVWAAKRGYTLTLVLGDVVSVLNVVEDLERYGVKAAPILGQATRGRHLQQLHRPADPTMRGLPLLNDERLKWVSTACTLQGLLDLSMPWKLRDAPCQGKLSPWNDDPDERQAASRSDHLDCPLFADCGRHEASRTLVDAPIWVATAPSLLHCRVPNHLTDTAMRYLELAWLRSDAFVIDEADRVQIQWDQAFSPSQTLAGPGRDAWLDEVRPLFDRHIRQTQGQHLATSTVRDWSIDINSAAMLVSRLRALMAEHAHIREWLREGYFNEWQLGVRLAAEIARRPVPNPPTGGPAWTTDEDCRQQWLDTFATWIQKPAGRYTGEDKRVAFLCALSARGYDNPTDITNELRDWLTALPDVQVGDQQLDRMAARFQTIMVIALLARKLEQLTRGCWEVESETGIESMSTSLVHKPPAEYIPLVPDAPMGNLLGFQYREDDSLQPNQLGTLSFFRCAGVGRWLLLNLPHLYRESPAQRGPAVLLLSATSWAGTSPRYDVQVPVSAVLTSEKAASVPVADRITLEYLPTKISDDRGHEYPIRVSGQVGERRAAALRTILAGLSKARPGLRAPRPSELEEIRDSLPDGRRRRVQAVEAFDSSSSVNTSLGFFQAWILRGRSLISAAMAAR